LWALAKTYGRQDLPYSGPIYRSHEIEGRRVRIRFDYAFGGLRSRDGKPLDWFTIAGPDGEFVPAQARVDGDSVVVWSEQVEQPKAARFAWDETAQPNLVNGAGLPAGPFRTNRPW
jgi:sialate O-acetylesterase